MSSRDKDTKSLQDKLKMYFKKGSSGECRAVVRHGVRRAGGGSDVAVCACVAAPVPARDELQVAGELERALAAGAPLPRRVRAMRDVAERLLTARLQLGGAERVWALVRDLLAGAPGGEGRAAALGLLAALAGQPAERTLRLRVLLLRWLREQLQRPAPAGKPQPPPDSRDHADELLRLQLLQRLTNGGRDITAIEEQVCIDDLLVKHQVTFVNSGLT